MDLKELTGKIKRSLRDAVDFGPKIMIGIDIGQSAIKACVLSSDKNGTSFKLQYFCRIPLSEGAIIEDEIHKEEEVIDAIKNATAGVGAGINKVCVGLSGPSTISRRLQLAGGSIEEIEDQVVWEAEQYIPFNVEESTISFHLVGENEGGGVDVVIAAAQNSLILGQRGLVEAAGLRPRIVDLNLLACVNVFQFVKNDELRLSEGTSTIFLDIGAQGTQFIICRDNTIVFTKEIAMGGVMVTEEIQRQMGVNHSDAESLKTVGDENGNLPEEVIEVIDQVNESFIADIKKTIEFYITSTSDESFEKVYLTGGGALTPGLSEKIESVLGLEIQFFNPFEKLEYGKKLSEEDLEEVGFLGVASIGLAMRKFK
ncbi:MAG: type IV pilus assembly protein PilM [Bacteriovoracaceae bacterium]|nr:type IV pilus assembly protein PilM [Bacteriovoracaceae bacterium]